MRIWSRADAASAVAKLPRAAIAAVRASALLFTMISVDRVYTAARRSLGPEPQPPATVLPAPHAINYLCHHFYDTVTMCFIYTISACPGLLQINSSKTTENVEPLPRTDLISSSPRWRATMCLTIARPNPVPPFERLEVTLAR